MRTFDNTKAREAKAELAVKLKAAGWPDHTGKDCFNIYRWLSGLKKFGLFDDGVRINIRSIKGRGVWVHPEGQAVVGFGKDRDAATVDLINKIRRDKYALEGIEANA